MPRTRKRNAVRANRSDSEEPGQFLQRNIRFDEMKKWKKYCNEFIPFLRNAFDDHLSFVKYARTQDVTKPIEGNFEFPDIFLDEDPSSFSAFNNSYWIRLCELLRESKNDVRKIIEQLELDIGGENKPDFDLEDKVARIRSGESLVLVRYTFCEGSDSVRDNNLLRLEGLPLIPEHYVTPSYKELLENVAHQNVARSAKLGSSRVISFWRKISMKLEENIQLIYKHMGKIENVLKQPLDICGLHLQDADLGHVYHEEPFYLGGDESDNSSNAGDFDHQDSEKVVVDDNFIDQLDTFNMENQ